MADDTNRSGLANSLTASPVCPRQPQEGSFEDFITKRYSHFSKYISYAEMCHLWDCESNMYLSTLPTRDRIIMREIESEILAKIDQEEVLASLNQRLIDLRNNKTKKKHAGHDLGAREFTLTYSPKWFSDDEARVKMKLAIEKLSRYYKNEIIQLRAVGEVGSNGLSHVHCFYKLGGGRKITDKNFQRAYPPWDSTVKQGFTGHKGGHHATVRCESDFQGYIEKEIQNAWLDVKISSDDPINGDV